MTDEVSKEYIDQMRRAGWRPLQLLRGRGKLGWAVAAGLASVCPEARNSKVWGDEEVP